MGITMKQIFLCVLSLSLSGALTGLLILLIRPVTRRLFSKKWNYYIWLLVIARLLIPVSFETSHFHFILPGDAKAAQEQSAGREINELDQQKDAENIDDTKDLTEVKEQVLLLEQQALSTAGSKGVKISDRIAEIAGMLWIFTVLIILLIKIKHYLCFTGDVRRESRPVSDNRVYEERDRLCERIHMRKKPQIYESNAVAGPITIGLLRPVIVLPKEERDLMQLPLILHHELLHVKRKDLWYKWMYQILLCIHWFNPVLYLAGRKLNVDCELSCDEAVLAFLTQEGKKAYGNLLLDAASRSINRNRKIPAITLLERKEDLKERLGGILQYRKKNGFKVFLSLLLSVGMVVLSACGSIEVSPDSMPVHLASEYEEYQYHYESFWDQIASWFDYDLDEFLARPVMEDKSGEAWQAYDNDDVIAGEDISSQWHMYSYKGGKEIKCSGMYLNGTASVLIVNASKEIEIQVNSKFEALKGKFKLVHVAPDGKVTVINDNGSEVDSVITVKEGRNVIKLVGQGAKIKELWVDFDFHERDFDSVFYSEDGECTQNIVDKIKAGTVDKDELMEHLQYMDAEVISEAFALLLKRGEELDADELTNLIIYSDSELSGKYLVEAVKNGEIDALDALAISNIKYYLSGRDLAELLLAMEEDLTFDIMYDCAPYLNSEGLEECVRRYREAGNQLTGSQFQKLAVYMDEDSLEGLTW